MRMKAVSLLMEFYFFKKIFDGPRECLQATFENPVINSNQRNPHSNSNNPLKNLLKKKKIDYKIV